MNGLLEFVFEGVPSNQLAMMIVDVICEKGNLTDAVQDGVELPFASVFNPIYWNNFVSIDEHVACTINLRYLNIGNSSVEKVTLQIIRYDGTNDVSVLISSDDCKKVNICNSEMIFHWAKSIADDYSVDNFFGGFEPASDEEMQLFTKTGVGAISEF